MAFDPNGQVMDLLRSCYSQDVMYVNGDPMQKTKCRWYFAAPTAKPFPVPHSFGSPTWDTEHPTPTVLGWDATSKRTYYNGQRSNTSPGTRYAGPLSFFQDGADTTADLPRGVNGTPSQCLVQPFGIAIGGSATALTGPHAIKTTCCPLGLPFRIKGVMAYGQVLTPNWTWHSDPVFTWDASSNCYRSMIMVTTHTSVTIPWYMALACRIVFGLPSWQIVASTSGPPVVPPVFWLANFANLHCDLNGGTSQQINGPTFGDFPTWVITWEKLP